MTFLKAPGYEDGHAQYSNPPDEQAFVVDEINALEQSPDWSSTAVVVNYDDSDGWYDHVYSGVTNPSTSVADNLTNTALGKIQTGNPTSGKCGSGAPLGGQQGRCGFSSRLPMMLISPCAAPDQVDHNMSDQASIVNFIEYNWGLPSISGSFDQALPSTDNSEGIPFDLAGLFDFSNCNVPAVQLDPKTGQVAMSNSHLHGDNQGSDWANGDLSGSKIDGQIQGTFAKGANLSGADLSGVQAQGSDFSSANLTGANLQHAQLQGANFEPRRPHECEPQGREDVRRLLHRRQVVEHDLSRRHEQRRRRPHVSGPPRLGPTRALIETPTGPRRYGRRGPVRSST